jgi:hypothetical protein
LPERQTKEIAKRAKIADRSEPYLVERIIDFAFDNGFELAANQGREKAGAKS